MSSSPSFFVQAVSVCLLQHSHLSSIRSGNRKDRHQWHHIQSRFFASNSLLSITTARYQPSMSTTSSNTQHPRPLFGWWLFLVANSWAHSTRVVSACFSQSFQSCLSLCLDMAQAAASIDGTSPRPRKLIHLLGVAIVAHLQTHYGCICKIMSIWNVRIHHDSTGMLALPKLGMSIF